jgi:transmembrane sensor
VQSYYHYLIDRYFNNTITREELDELLVLAQSGEYDDELTTALLQQWEIAGTEKKDTGIGWDAKLEAMLQQYRPVEIEAPALRRVNRYRFAAAAVLLLLTGAGIYYILRPTPKKVAVVSKDSVLSADTVSLRPGTNGAVLTLGDGSRIVLDSAGNGLLAMQGAAKVLNDKGAIRYDDAPADSTKTIYNTLSTPRGKQYRLELSDGTRVWLNAASSIRFPTSFPYDMRRVEITGEAYFEVRPLPASPGIACGKPSAAEGGGGEGAKVPFVVAFTTPAGTKAEVQVLGTHFNINAYDDEAAVKTTLLEGKVKVSQTAIGPDSHREQSAKDGERSVVLKPGEQAVLSGANSRFTIADSRLTIDHSPDIDAVMAWKNGYFSFSETDMATLMRQIARWYDVEIEYAGAIPNRRFGGEISRNSNAEQVLKIMEESDVHFRIAGRKIIVLP